MRVGGKGLNPSYHPFYPDVTHVRKDTRPSPGLPYYKRQKAGRGLGYEAKGWYYFDIMRTEFNVTFFL